MPGTTIGISLNQGYAGAFSRTATCKIKNRIAKNEAAFGQAAVTNSDGTAQPFGASNVAADFAGVFVREVKQATDYTAQAAKYGANEPADILQAGTCTIVCQNGTPTANAPVYIRIATNAGLPNAVIGGFEATADGANSVKLTNVRFVSSNIDANSLTEVDILYPVNV